MVTCRLWPQLLAGKGALVTAPAASGRTTAVLLPGFAKVLAAHSADSAAEACVVVLVHSRCV